MRSLVRAGTLVLTASFLTACGEKELTTAELVMAFAPVCDGEGVSEAAAFTTDAGVHPVVEVDLQGVEPLPFDLASVVEEWAATTVSEAELVLCHESTIFRSGSCGTYTPEGGGLPTEVTANKFQTTVRLHEAQTGERIGASSFVGSSPKPCPGSFYISEACCDGDFAWDKVVAWMEPIVGRCWSQEGCTGTPPTAS